MERIMRNYLLFFLYGLLMAVTPVPAQIFKYINTDNGLGSRRVLAIEQDSYGYMWILNHKGIDRYDGSQFTHYKLQENGKDLYFYPDMHHLRMDDQDELWEYGKDGRIFRFDDQKDIFEPVFQLRTVYPQVQSTPISAVYFDVHGGIWFACGQLLVVYNTKTGQSTLVSEQISEPILAITCDGEDNYFFADNYAIRQTVYKDGQLVDIRKIIHPDIFQINYIYYHAHSRQLLINTLRNGLMLMDPETDTFRSLETQLKDICINTIKPYPGHNDEVLIATDGDGVYRLDLRNGRLNRFLQENAAQPNQMNGSIVKDLLIDNDFRIWSVIYPTGITVYSEKYPAYQWIKHSHGDYSLVDNRVNAITQDTEGDIWFATSDGISCYTPSTHRWKNYFDESSDQSPNRNRIFTSICEVKPGIIVAGGYMAGTYLIDKHNGRVERSINLIAHPQDLPDQYIRSIIVGKDSTIWAGGARYLTSFNSATRQTTQYATSYPIVYLKEKDETALWVGTIDGLFLFDRNTQKLKRYNCGFQIGCVTTIYQSADGRTTYIGTYGNGLFIIDTRTGRTEHFHKENCGLENNNIYTIVPNKYDDLFLGTENGLTLYDHTKRKFIIWTKEQGLLAASFNQDAGIRTKDGKLIFGTNEGAILLNDSTSLIEDFNSHMVLTDLHIMYRAVHPQEKNSPLTLPLDDTEQIVLKYKENTFSINVSSINYDHASSIHYSWKLEGFYDEWTPPSDYNLIRYTNLSPGDYTLRIRSIQTNSNTVLEERTLRIHVNRPFWRSVWAYLLYSLLLTVILYAWFRYQIIRRDRKTSQEKINFFIHTAHDIRTPLTLIKAPLGEILNNEQLSEQGIVNINLALQNTDNLSTLTNNLMNFQKEEMYSSKVLVTKTELKEYLSQYLVQFKNYATQKGIDLQFHCSFERLDVWIDHTKMDSILRNLISNALKYTPQGGQVRLTASCTKSHWHLSVSDTGIGIPKQEQKKLFKSLFRGRNATNQLITGAGVGMLLTYRLIKNHGGKINFSSTENVGTDFYLNFPIHSKLYSYKDENAEALSPSVTIDTVEVPHNIIPQLQQPKQTDAPHLLIVEDNQSLCAFLAQSLSDSYFVDTAGNGQEALEHIRQRHPDLIVSDVMMPIMDGMELCAAVKGNIETSHIAFILLTALADRDDILKGLDTRADLYIVKPFDLLVLKANIFNLLENRRMLRKKLQQMMALPESVTEQLDLPSALDQKFLQDITDYIKQNLDNELTVDSLCAHMNMSRTSFYNKMKSLAGIAPNDFIRNIRMREAALLLRSQQYSVSEVADMTGFADPKYFTDTFKKFFGMTPSKYKQQKEV